MDKIKQISHKYHLIWFTAAQLVFLLLHRSVIHLWFRMHPEPLDFFQPSEDALSLLFVLMFELIWLTVLIYCVKQIRYREVTGGRNFMADKMLYERSYHDLMHYYTDADKSRINVSDLRAESWRDVDGIPLGTVDGRLLRRGTDEKGNLMIFGLPGFNKTTGSIATAALRFGATMPETPYYIHGKNSHRTTGSTVVIDIKGDILHWTSEKRRIKIFNPEDANTCHFDPFLGIDEMPLSERRAFIEGMSEIIVQEEEGGKYFTDGGRDFFCGVTLYLLNKDIHTSFIQIVDAILHGNGIDWVTRIYESTCDDAKDYLASYYGSNEKNVAGCYNSISKALRKFRSGALPELLNAQGECISSDMLDAGWDIYLELPQDKISLYSSVTTLLIQQLMNSFMKRPDASSGVHNRPVLFILDEMPKLRFDFDTLENCLSTMRSKSVTCMMAAQSIGQYKKRYGDQGFINLVDCCQYICCLSALEPSSRKWFSDLLGTRKVLRRSTSSGSSSAFGEAPATGGISVQETRELILQPEDFSQLDDKAVIYIVGQGYVIADKCKVYEQ